MSFWDDLSDPLGIGAGGKGGALSDVTDPLQLFHQSKGGVKNSLLDPLNLTGWANMPGLNDPSGLYAPNMVTNPWLDNLGIYNSQRAGRNSLVIGLGSYQPAAAAGPNPPKTFPIPPDLGPTRPPPHQPWRPGVPGGPTYTP